MIVESKIKGMNNPDRFRQRPRWHFTPQLMMVLALLTGWLSLGGCGVKGPPVPLQQKRSLPAVTDLAYRVADRQVTLTWRMKSPLDRQAAREATFIVRRSKTALDQPACQTCLQVFETVSRLPYVETADASYALNLPLAAGFQYVFTVHLKIGGALGPDSAPLRFNYPSDGVAVPVEDP